MDLDITEMLELLRKGIALQTTSPHCGTLYRLKETNQLVMDLRTTAYLTVDEHDPAAPDDQPPPVDDNRLTVDFTAFADIASRMFDGHSFTASLVRKPKEKKGRRK